MPMFVKTRSKIRRFLVMAGPVNTPWDAVTVAENATLAFTRDRKVNIVGFSFKI